VIASGRSAPKTYGTAKWKRGPARSRHLVKALSQDRQLSLLGLYPIATLQNIQLNHFITGFLS
jgi:hypothetical protein